MTWLKENWGLIFGILLAVLGFSAILAVLIGVATSLFILWIPAGILFVFIIAIFISHFFR